MMTRALFIILFLFASSCGSPALVANEKTVFDEEGVSKSELQSRVQRFAGVFIDRTNQALIVLESDLETEGLKRQVLERLLAYSSSAIEIASGPTPEVNLLDMVVFVTLVSDRWDKFWRPKVFKSNSRAFSEELAQSENEIWAVLEKVSTNEQRRQLKKIIQDWKTDNKDQVLVERVRLNEIAKIEGEASEERAEKVEGMFTTVKGAVSAADQGVLIANRALFLSQKFPFILRLQARLGVQQTLKESLAFLSEEDLRMDDASELTGSLGQTAAKVGEASLKIKATLEAFRKAFPKEKDGATAMQKMDKALALAQEANRLAARLNGGGIQAQEAIEETSDTLSSAIWNATFGALLFSFFSALFWWGGYLIVKRKTSVR